MVFEIVLENLRYFLLLKLFKNNLCKFVQFVVQFLFYLLALES